MPIPAPNQEVYHLGNLLTNFLRGAGLGVSILGLISTFIFKSGPKKRTQLLCCLGSSLGQGIQLIVAFMWDQWREDCYTRVLTLYSLTFVSYTSYWFLEVYFIFNMQKMVSKPRRRAYRIYCMVLFLIRWLMGLLILFRYEGRQASNLVCSTYLPPLRSIEDKLIEMVYNISTASTLVYLLATSAKSISMLDKKGGTFKVLWMIITDKAAVLIVSMIVNIIYVSLVFTSTDPTNISVLGNIPSTSTVVYTHISLMLNETWNHSTDVHENGDLRKTKLNI